MDLTHFDEAGRAHMVDVGEKPETAREAVATGQVRMRVETLRRIRAGTLAKGDVLAVAQVAGVMAAKQTPQIIPMCHTILLTGVDIAFELAEAARAVEGEASGEQAEQAEQAEQVDGLVGIQATVRTVGKTGAEMEALTAVSAAALTIYDMCKAIDRGMVIEQVRLERKSGGKSGEFMRESTPSNPADHGA